MASASVVIGQKNAKTNNWADALHYFQKAIEAFESSKKQEDFQVTNVNMKAVEWNYGIAAEAALRLGSNELAYAYATNLVEINPQEIRNQIVLASTLAKIGRKEEALSLIDKSFGSNSNSPVAIQIKESFSAGSR